eukprot:6469293-Amphidinium_carterae.2
MAAQEFLASRLVERMRSEPLMRQFETNAFARALFKVSRKVRQVCGPAACVALCRLFLRGICVPSKHCHAGCCCLCFEWHTGGLEAIVSRGSSSSSACGSLRFHAIGCLD